MLFLKSKNDFYHKYLHMVSKKCKRIHVTENSSAQLLLCPQV